MVIQPVFSREHLQVIVGTLVAQYFIDKKFSGRVGEPKRLGQEPNQAALDQADCTVRGPGSLEERPTPVFTVAVGRILTVIEGLAGIGQMGVDLTGNESSAPVSRPT
ncbi:MAG: hypothetical protein DWQ08_12000 [Proteobacteria bacterium]|nr:MAG: hypothetical protein DWQ08_12000 [Pseudomonadota bacterium]